MQEPSNSVASSNLAPPKLKDNHEKQWLFSTADLHAQLNSAFSFCVIYFLFNGFIYQFKEHELKETCIPNTERRFPNLHQTSCMRDAFVPNKK